MLSVQERLEQASATKLSSRLNSMMNNEEAMIRNGDEFDAFKEKVHLELLDRINYGVSISASQKDEVYDLVKSIVESLGSDISRPIRNRLVEEIFDETIGLGPLERLLKDPDVTEIMVNGPEQVYVERQGKISLSDVKFKDNGAVLTVIDRIISPLGRRCDESTPMVDARLPDGSRVNAIIPPVSLVGPSITIRKFSKKGFEVSDLIRFNSLSYQMAAFLEACVKGKANIIVFGGTGSGKTTLLNTLSGFIPENERIVTIEDAAELQLKQPHKVILEARPDSRFG